VPPGCLPRHFLLIEKNIRLIRSNLQVGALKGHFTRLYILFTGQGAREGYLAVVDQAVISLANFIATLILARNISPTELGMYGVGFTMLRLIRAIQEGLTIQPLNAIGAAQDLPTFKRYASSTSLIQIGMALLSSVSAILVGGILIKMGKDVAGPTVFSLWFVFLWWQMQEYIRRMMYTRGSVFLAVVNTVIANLVRLGLMVYWNSTNQLTGITGLDAIGWGALVALIPGLWQTRQFWTARFYPLWNTLKENWGFGKWVMGGMLANWVSVELYPVITAGLVSFAAAGAYRALQNLVAPIHLLLRAVDTYMTPRAARTYHEKELPGLQRQVRLTYLIIGLPILSILGLAVLFPAQILELLYGKTYLEYSEAMVLMAIFYALMYAYWPLQIAFKAIQVSRPLFIANAIAFAVMFTAGIWAIQQWGVYGTLIGQIMNAAIVAVILWATWLNFLKRSRAH
jgi:O-antigen/teichoic acid export membrane protein